METNKIKKKVYVHQIQSASWKNFLPLSAAMLVSYAESIPKISKEYDFEIKILRESPLETVKSYALPDVLAFSAYSWNFKQSLEIARIGKIEYPDSIVVFGGPMISNNPKYISEFLKKYPFIDIVVHGMGEWPFSEILLNRIEQKEFGTIAGVSYKNKEDFIVTTNPVYNRNVNELPSPFLDGTFDKIMLKYGDKITGALWETNRGCPYTCTYCVQGNSQFSKILTFDKNRLYKELEWISKNKFSYVFGSDANFGILPRDIEIAKMIADFGKKQGYPKFFIINWAKFSSKKMIEIAEILREGGVHTRLTLSMQSLNDETLKAIKRKNLELLEFEDLKKESMKKKIDTYTELILGLPNETYDSFVSAINKCMDTNLNHFLVVYLCRLLDATEMAEPDYIEKYQFKTKISKIGIARHEWSDSEIDEEEKIIVGTATLPIQDWEKLFTFTNFSLVLYNFRLAFFIFNYLKKEHSVDLIDLINHIVKNGCLYPTIAKALSIINKGKQNILEEKPNLISLDFTGKMLFETHEAALLVLLNEKDIFYKELNDMIKDYLLLKQIIVQPLIFSEILKYQSFLIPNWKKTDKSQLSLEFNIPEYFEALCIKNKPISINKKKTEIEIKNNEENPIDFVKARLTISTFKILETI